LLIYNHVNIFFGQIKLRCIFYGTDPLVTRLAFIYTLQTPDNEEQYN
jgi:hypothetical protein